MRRSPGFARQYGALTIAPVITHFFPLVPVARAPREAGHEITFAAHESLKNARQLQQEIRTLPGPGHAVARLGEIVRTHRTGSTQASGRADRPAAAFAAYDGGGIRAAVRT
jgi:hypothetical protein